MLKDANVLTKLGDIFVEYTLSTSTDERSREDILAHVSDVLIGMTTRVLQMAKMFIQVPSDLNLYSNPTVVARMVEAGVKNFRDSDGGRHCSPESGLNHPVSTLLILSCYVVFER